LFKPPQDDRLARDPALRDTVCPHCGARTARVVYEYFSTAVMFCATCEASWTVEKPPGALNT
jgi:hypothetical protein